MAANMRRQIIGLGGANAIDAMIRALTPIAFVRLMPIEDFASYRLFWLVATTVMLIAPLGMPRSLLFFLPRSSAADAGRYVGQTFAFLLVAGVVSALIVGPWNPLFPESFDQVFEIWWVLPLFIVLWVFGSSAEVIALANKKAEVQSLVIVFLAVLRVAGVLAVAALTQDIKLVFVVLVLIAALRAAIAIAYSFAFHGRHVGFDKQQLKAQLKYAAPFGLSGTLAQLRGSIAQWLVAFMFMPAALAFYSVASNVGMIFTVVRKSVAEIILPKMSEDESRGDTNQVLKINSKGNVAVGVFVFPLLAFCFVFANEIIVFVYTQSYAPAIPVFRALLLGLLVHSVEIATVLVVLQQGRFVLLMSAASLLVGPAASYALSFKYGLTGIALGASLGSLFNQVLSFARTCSVLEKPIHELQDWSSLLAILVAASVSAIAAQFAITGLLADQHVFWRLAAAGCLFASLYVALLIVLKRGWLLRVLLGKGRWQD